jgi:D-glycero-alpha-D-manno-heptose-7-phosphate kinase
MSINLEIFLVEQDCKIQDALKRIEENRHGTIFTAGSNGVVVGMATDGDIRRHLLNGGALDDSISRCANTDFVRENIGTPREVLIKRLDHQIRTIPLLDSAGRLAGVVSRDHIPMQSEEPVYARARAPVRISFGGGGSDLTHYFAENEGGAVINTTISLYSHSTLRIRSDGRVKVQSLDLGETLEGEDLKNALARPGRFGLVQAMLRAINPDFGFELYLHSDYPMKSGLGGSAVVAAAMLGCFNQFRLDQWDLYELAEIAYQAERHYLGVAGGWQDQYATVFGGFNFMEFRMDKNVVHPLRIHPDTMLELEESLILCNTGGFHDSGDIHDDQRAQMATCHVRDMVETNVRLSYEMRNDLLRGRLLEFGHLLDKAWEYKRHFSRKISTSHLDLIYAEACAHGAVGGKLLGAGGGGFFLFYVPPFRKHGLISYLQAAGLEIRPFRFEPQGLQAWTVRECRNHRESSAS